MELTTYDRRLEALQQIRHEDANRAVEITAAVATYERLKTAIAIAGELMPDASDLAIATLASEIGAAARHEQDRLSREYGSGS